MRAPPARSARGRGSSPADHGPVRPRPAHREFGFAAGSPATLDAADVPPGSSAPGRRGKPFGPGGRGNAGRKQAFRRPGAGR